VDNPHTKPVAFWEELIGTVQRHDPEVLFLSEAFTKPKMMQVLGKVGFTQSYTYFTWRETKQELMEYVGELTQSEMRWYFRGNFWPNTPDILPGHLQHAGPAMFKLRAALAATLSSCWGMYSGYEFCENDPYPGKEEYHHSEKYELKQRDRNAPGNIKAFIGQLNKVRQENAALQDYDNVIFHLADHDQVLCYSRATADLSNRLVFVVSLNAHEPVATMVHLNLAALGIVEGQAFVVHDLLHQASYRWTGASNYVALRPDGVALHVFRVEV
jgi:starch synthase (maltosyl-transferring)